MKKDDIIHLSLHIITEYYKNNLQPFFEYVSDDILWIGPAQMQQIQGRENLLRLFSLEEHDLTFTMGDVKVLYSSPHRYVKEVLLHYNIFTHYPSGNTDMHDQWLHYTWREKRVKKTGNAGYRPEIVCLHISNAWPYDDHDTIYPVHYENLSDAAPVLRKPERFVTVKAHNGYVYRILVSHILYLCTVKHSAQLQIHTEDNVITIHDTLSHFEKEHPGLFLRIHSGYLLNPAHVTGIRRFAVTLTDGTELPLPEKKYTRIKNMLFYEDTQQ